MGLGERGKGAVEGEKRERLRGREKGEGVEGKRGKGLRGKGLRGRGRWMRGRAVEERE